MSAEPLVSIIIPTYNYGHLIKETLDCLIHQTYKNWEAIIVDDGSTDDTEKIVFKIISKEARIIFLKQKNNGVSSARNKGLSLSKGKYIQFLDADDLISNNKIKIQVKYLEENPEVHLCLSNTLYFESGKGGILYTDFNKSNLNSTSQIQGRGFEIIEKYILNNQSVVQSPLFRREILQKVNFFNEAMRYLEDWDFWLRCAFKNFLFHFLIHPECYSLIRLHPQSASSQENLILEAEGPFRNNINVYIKDSKLSENQKKQLLKLNQKQLITTYKYLMYKVSFFDFKTFYRYYKQINNNKLYFKIFLKALNIKRKKAI